MQGDSSPPEPLKSAGDFLYFNFIIMSGFVPVSGRIETTEITTKASTAYAVGDVLYNDGTNEIPAVSTTDKVSYVAAEDKASTDTTTGKILVWKVKDCVFRAPVSTGTLTAAYEGRVCDLDDADGIDIDSTTESCVRIEKFITSSVAHVSFDTGKNT